MNTCLGMYNFYVAWPGSVHDARVFANSSLYQRAHDKEILNSCSRAILGKTIFSFLVGDSAYLLSSWLMKPFPHGSTWTDNQKNFHYRLSRARIVSENAFGRLQARWRRLMKQNDMHTTFQTSLLLAAYYTMCVKYMEVIFLIHG